MTRPRLARNVLALGAVSLLTDASSEMIYPLLPEFLDTTLGASGLAIGVLEGTVIATASLLQLLSGWLSDRGSRRKPLVVAGYGVASVARPLIGLAQTVGHVLALRVTDRIGKGLRTAPRDALLADSVDARDRGRAYGFHRACDHAGAVIGPLIAAGLLHLAGVEIRTIFLLAAIPAALSLVVLVAAVKDVPKPADRAASPAKSLAGGSTGPVFDRRGWTYLAVVLLFTLGTATELFLLLRAAKLGVPGAALPLLWAMHHVVKSLSSTPGGALSDRIGRKPLVAAGWALQAVVYVAFGFASEPWHAWALFALYGLHFGLVDGAQKAFVADLAPAARRGAAFGWFHLSVGLAALPASALFGAVLDATGPPAAFGLGAALALAASVLLVLLVPARRPV